MKKQLTLVSLLLFLLFGFWGCRQELPKGKETTETALSDLVNTPKSGVVRTRSEVTDKYEFPDISGMNEWTRPGIIKDRIDALQIPENVLASISTEGLLETCLEFPYLVDILHFSDFQQSFNVVVSNFNGFRELLRRPDLVDALLDKYYGITEDVKGVYLLESVERGGFSFRNFVTEFILAQDAVFEKLNEEQEIELFLLSLENKKIKNDYSDVFGYWHSISRALLYAKKIMHDNAAGAYTNELSRFIKAPLHINPNTAKYLDDYINAKYKSL